MAGDLVVPSASRAAATYNSTTIATKGRELVVAVNVDVVTGSLVVEIEWSNDGGVEFFKADPADSFASIDAVGGRVERFSKKGDHYRVNSIVTTGPITYDVRVDYE